jgi:hypothetical protein
VPHRSRSPGLLCRRRSTPMTLTHGLRSSPAHPKSCFKRSLSRGASTIPSPQSMRLIIKWLFTEPLATAGARCASIAALAPALCDCSSDASRPAGRAIADTRVDLPRQCDRLDCLSGPNGRDGCRFRNRFSARTRPSRTAADMSRPTGVTAMLLCTEGQERARTIECMRCNKDGESARTWMTDLDPGKTLLMPEPTPAELTENASSHSSKRLPARTTACPNPGCCNLLFGR